MLGLLVSLVSCLACFHGDGLSPGSLSVLLVSSDGWRNSWRESECVWHTTAAARNLLELSEGDVEVAHHDLCDGDEERWVVAVMFDDVVVHVDKDSAHTQRTEEETEEETR